MKKCMHYRTCMESGPLCDDPKCSVNQKMNMKDRMKEKEEMGEVVKNFLKNYNKK